MSKLTDENRLSLTHPELCKEWDCKKNGELKPEDLSYGSSKKIWWICSECNSEYDAIIKIRAIQKTGCPYCSGKKVNKKNSLFAFNPRLVEEWDYTKNNELTPEIVMPNSHKKVWWKCQSGHGWEARVSERNKGRNCPYCSCQKLSDKNRLSKLYPELCKEWNYERNEYIKPEAVSWCGRAKVWWECQLGHEWETEIYNRTYGKQNCPYCSSHKVSGKNRFSELCPELLEEWNFDKNKNLSPDNISYSSNKKVWWKCKNGHEWEAKIGSRFEGNGCSLCNKVILKNNLVFDSKVEAYVFLKLKQSGFLVKQNKKYGFGNYKCDFYLPETNTYVEVTGFHEKMKGYGNNFWRRYIEKITMKRRYVENILNANFRFIQVILGRTQNSIVRKNMK